MASVPSVIMLLFVQMTQILQFPVINVLEIFGGYVLISRQYHLMFQPLTFLFFMQPVSLNQLARLLLVLGLGKGPPGNFI